MSTVTNSLKEKWAELKSANPHLRIRNAAEKLGVSEAELLATQCGENVTRLKPEFTAILEKIESLGKVMALSRNNDVVHERKGVYLNPSLNNPHVGLFVGADIDLRIFFKPWTSAYAVSESTGKGDRLSLQFFALDGEALHKIYLTEASNTEAYHALVKTFTHDNQEPFQTVEAWPEEEKELPDDQINAAEFREGWVNLKDTHDFFGLVKKYRLTRTQALRLAPEGEYAVKVSNEVLRPLLDTVAEKEIPIMVFVGNKGMIQIHTGPVKKLAEFDGWYNVLDPDFNLHIREAGIHETWVVRKPTEDGMVTAFEFFDAAGTQIMQVFGKRKPGIPEIEDWRIVVKDLQNRFA